VNMKKTSKPEGPAVRSSKLVADAGKEPSVRRTRRWVVEYQYREKRCHYTDYPTAEGALQCARTLKNAGYKAVGVVAVVETRTEVFRKSGARSATAGVRVPDSGTRI